MREMDRAAIRERGFVSAVLMEKVVARAVAQAAARVAEARPERPGKPRRAVCFCGRRQQRRRAWPPPVFCWRRTEVRAVLVGRREKMTPDCREMERRLEEKGVPWRTSPP